MKLPNCNYTSYEIIFKLKKKIRNNKHFLRKKNKKLLHLSNNMIESTKPHEFDCLNSVFELDLVIISIFPKKSSFRPEEITLYFKKKIQ